MEFTSNFGTLLNISVDVRMESVLSMAVDTKKVYLNTASELIVYDISSKTSQQFDVRSVDLEAFCPSCQTFPGRNAFKSITSTYIRHVLDSACLVLPPKSQNISARPVGESSVEIVISDSLWPLECARVSRPSIFHIVTIKPTTEKDCINNPKCFEKVTLLLIFDQELGFITHFRFRQRQIRQFCLPV